MVNPQIRGLTTQLTASSRAPLWKFLGKPVGFADYRVIITHETSDKPTVRQKPSRVRMPTTFKGNSVSLPEEALKSFESSNGFRLPIDYYDFLVRHNGGKPSPNACWVDGIDDSVLVDELYGISGDGSYDLQFWMEEYGDEMPEGSVIIGGDPGGAMFILGTTDDFKGVYLWDHEHRYPGSNEENGNTFFLAETFSAWVQSFGDLPLEPVGSNQAVNFNSGFSRAADGL